MYYKSSGLLLSAVLIAGCGGSGEDFTLADGLASYTGVRDLAYLDEGNAGAFLGALFSSGLDSPNLAFRSSSVEDNVAPGAVPGSMQSLLLRHIRQSGVTQQGQYQQRAVEVSDTVVCEDGGKTDISGDVDDSAGTAKLNLNYVDCQSGGIVANGKALALIADNSGSFNQLDAVTFSYHGLEMRSLDSGEITVLTGTLEEAENVNTGTLSNTTKLHRQVKDSDKQSMLDLVKTEDASGSLTVSGDVYQGYYGRSQVSTLQRLVVDGDIPMSGQVLMTGAESSKLRVTALGQQYDEVTDETGIMLQVEVDEDGDGDYESQSLINTDDL